MDNVLTCVPIFCIMIIGKVKRTPSQTMSKGGIINAEVGCKF
jgi:hypothetical protein